MRIIEDVSLKENIFWKGARALWKRLTDDELQSIENDLSYFYPNGIDKNTLNNIFWFDTDFIFETIGLFDPDEMQEEKDKKEEEFWSRPIIR